MSRYSVGRRIARDIMRGEGRKAVGRRIQKEAVKRPESIQVRTPSGKVWMSPIESKLYDAMLKEGLSPIPQLRVQAYFVDFGFPDIKLAIEADGQAYHDGERRQRDQKRDWILKTKYGWTVMRFSGSTIHNKPGSCAFVIKRAVQDRRRAIEERRKARNETLARPFRRIASLFGRG